MANQPTKYSKFLIGAASAALVASAVAPVASAADFKDTKGNTHEAAIDALSDAGVITGYPDGTFLPNKTLTRSDVVKLMGKWLVAEGSVVPTDWKTNMRFTDLKSTSNEELLKFAAVVFDNGVFVGTPDGKLNATGDITRENMAVVLVRAFDRVHDIDLASYVAGKDFKKDVTDLGKAKAEARPAIDVLDYFDITNPAAPAFNPKLTTTRGQFATFLYKTTKADFSDVTPGVVVGAATVKAVNATTVEVTFKEKVENLNSLNFKIDGLTVSNAAVKQTGDDKTVVLTTAVQKGGEKYTVTLNEKAIGSFTGVSAVIPTTIKLTNTSAQSKVGNQVILSAYVGAKEAGVPVTFNVDAPAGSLNKDQVVEVFTNADGLATYSYTQYSAGVDSVAVYPTGAPTVRDFATVYWGVQNILTLESVDATTGNVLANGSAKTYKVTYLNPVTGAVVPNQVLNVTFAENMNVTSDKLSTAVVKDVTTGTSFNPYQLTNGNVNAATIKTDSNGQATFTVSGTNTSATPIVFVDTTDNNTGNGKWDATELFATTEKLTFSGAQLANKFTLTASGSAQTAVGPTNGRKYKVVVTDKDGKPYAGGVVNLALNETIDKEIGTNSNATFTTNSDLEGELLAGFNTAKNQLKLNSKGEGEFILSSNIVNDYGTPVVWIDQNVAENHQSGVLENGEPSIIGEKTFFETENVVSSKLTVTKNGTAFTGTFAGLETAVFTYHATNQSGNTFATNKRVTYTITNNGPDALDVVASNGTSTSIAAYGTTSVTVDGSTPNVSIDTNGANGAVTVSAAGNVITTAANGDVTVGKYLGTQSASAKFSKFADVAVATGTVDRVNASAKTFRVTDAVGKTFDYNYASSNYQKNGQTISLTAFESQLVGNTVSVTKDADGKLTFNLIGNGTGVGVAPTAPTISTAGPVKAGDTVTISPAVPTGQKAWLAPAGTTTFVTGPTMTTANAGATSILAPATDGDYKLFYVDGFGRSAASETTIKVDANAPTASVTTTAVKAGTTVNVKSTEAGIAYLVLDSANITTKANAELAVTGGTATKIAVAANTDTAISTTGLADGAYKVVAADASGNLSAESTGTVTVDSTVPVITSVTGAALNLTTGTLVLTVVGASAIGDLVDVTKVTIADASVGTPVVLSTSTGVVTSANTLSITLSAADIASLAGTSGGDVTLDAAAGLLVDAAGNVSVNAADTGNAVVVTP